MVRRCLGQTSLGLHPSLALHTFPGASAPSFMSLLKEEKPQRLGRTEEAQGGVTCVMQA